MACHKFAIRELTITFKVRTKCREYLCPIRPKVAKKGGDVAKLGMIWMPHLSPWSQAFFISLQTLMNKIHLHSILDEVIFHIRRTYNP
ncbi:Uncharacterised protein [Legionella pneumophila]|nr:Uncharacterised protein [Legionella pneumophila]SFZ45322.1 Uncharacterised protein [Legionella pneumophila]